MCLRQERLGRACSFEHHRNSGDLDNTLFAHQFGPMTDFPVTLFHNPRCSKSRAALALIRERGIEPDIVLYLQTGWTKAGLHGLLTRMDAAARDVLRTGEAEAAALGADASEAMIITAMVAHPILVERPIVQTPLGVVIARPPQRVFEVLPAL